MLKFKVFPYKMGSASAKELANALDVKRVRANGRYRYYPNHIIINWGNSSFGAWDLAPETVKYLNDPRCVCYASNKLWAFRAFKSNEIKHPLFFTNKQDLIHYTESLNSFPTIYCRKTLTGHSGSGIVLANGVSEIVDAPLYTIRFKAQKEWRIHVFRDEVIDYAKKSRRMDMEERSSGLIRNYASGWIFRRDGVSPSEAITNEAIKAVKVLGLDFGAVDIAEDKDGNVCTYEVNTSPGMAEGSTTLRRYVETFKRYADSIR